MITFFKASFFIIIVSILTIPVFSQDSGIYYDVLFDEYIELETKMLELNDTGKLNSYNLGEIENLRLKASDGRRNDVLNRLDMLSFVVKIGLENQLKTQNADKLISEIKSSEEEYREKKSMEKALSAAGKITVATAITSSAIFVSSALISSNYYDKYKTTEIADQAAFYLFWWQNLESVAFVSALTTIITGTAAGILTAVK